MSVFHNSIKHSDIFSTYSSKTMLVTNERSINNCLKLLFTTSVGELYGDPEFGSTLMELIYEPNVDVLKELVVQEITEKIAKYEPRITVTDISFLTHENSLGINVRYYIHDLGDYGDFKISVSKE